MNWDAIPGVYHSEMCTQNDRPSWRPTSWPMTKNSEHFRGRALNQDLAVPSPQVRVAFVSSLCTKLEARKPQCHEKLIGAKEFKDTAQWSKVNEEDPVDDRTSRPQE